MKRTIVTNFETSDGRTFTEARPAQEHETSLLIASLRPADAPRLTAAELIRMMCDNAAQFMTLLDLFVDEEEVPGTEEDQKVVGGSENQTATNGSDEGYGLASVKTEGGSHATDPALEADAPATEEKSGAVGDFKTSRKSAKKVKPSE